MSGPGPAAALARRLLDGDLTAAPAVLNLLETTTPAARAAAAELLGALSPTRLGREAPGQVIGVTGPPGVGKSTLLSELAAGYRARGQSVAILAVDPSSKRSGGSLLGDRARIRHDPADRQVFIRSTAAGERLGGLAPATRAAASVLAVAFDVVVIETVGVGQSETEVAEVADTVAVVVQPGSGDVLQFLKAGIMETPDVLVVTKADLGRVAQRAMADLHAALRSVGATGTQVIAVSSIPPATGIDKLIGALDAHRDSLDLAARRLRARRAHALADFIEEHGAAGLRALGGRRAAEAQLADADAGRDVASLTAELERAAAGARARRP
ncbi:ArgK/MeaB family GTPase [Conexibacter sp. DBS9H8]|uniref:ArgK/MeaB family GTPase n=1 Tax=Conexibacter sp. DBS9H8 TaxID=2937801 RepID=UPI00200C0F72|nr:GTP-binding protein [Conexibacter sp. DBS9H8]